MQQSDPIGGGTPGGGNPFDPTGTGGMGIPQTPTQPVEAPEAPVIPEPAVGTGMETPAAPVTDLSGTVAGGSENPTGTTGV